jgi:type IV pilus assembly protein PilC
MCSTMREQIQNGTNFSEAVAEHSRVFPPYYIAILRTAEHTGQLDLALDQLSEYLEREIASWAKIKSALTYPFVVLGMSILVMFVLALWVLPRFTKLFKELGGKLPLPTRMLMGLSTALSKFWYVEVGLIALFIAGLVWLNKSDRGKLIRDKTFLRIPLVKDVVLYSVVERVFRIVSTMVQAGVPLPDTIAAAIRGTNNKVFERALTSAQERMLEGEGLAGPVKDTGVFPRAAMQMVKVGEETGTLDTQLENAAVYYGRELEYKVQKLTTLFEPLIIIFMGVIVGFVAVALVMAMYGIFGQLNHLRGRGS